MTARRDAPRIPARGASCAILSAVTRPGPVARGRRTRAREQAVRDRAGRDRRAGPRSGGTAGGVADGRPGGIADRPGARGHQAGGPREPFAPAYRIVELRGPEGPLRARVDPGVPERRPGTTFASRSSKAPAGPVRRFVRAWGWRAYALPVLTLLTVLCGMDVANGTAAGMPLVGSSSTGPPSAAAPAV